MFHAGHAVDQTTRFVILASALGFMLLEYLVSWLAHHEDETHNLAETAASLGIAVGRQLIQSLEMGLVAIPFTFVYDHRLFNFAQTTPAAIVALFLAVEFTYYWQHRFSHGFRWMWATHAVHHSPTKLNMTAAVRLGWTGNISGNFLFFLPLAWLGFHPLGIVAALGANLLYQFFIHTELPLRLGPLEWVLNTPAHHRVHHAINTICLDKNFGGVLIVFDRLFGTFATAPGSEPLRYGIADTAHTNNPVRILFGEWAAIFADARKAPTFAAKLRALFAAPAAPPPQSHGGASAAIRSASTTLVAGE